MWWDESEGESRCHRRGRRPLAGTLLHQPYLHATPPLEPRLARPPGMPVSLYKCVKMRVENPWIIGERDVVTAHMRVPHTPNCLITVWMRVTCDGSVWQSSVRQLVGTVTMDRLRWMRYTQLDQVSTRCDTSRARSMRVRVCRCVFCVYMGVHVHTVCMRECTWECM